MKELYYAAGPYSLVPGVWVDIQGKKATILGFFKTKRDNITHLMEMTDDEIVEGLVVATKIGNKLEQEGYEVKR